MTNETEAGRRELLLGLSAAPLAASIARAAAPPEEWAVAPKKILDTFIRVQGDLTGAVCPWRWHGYMVAVTPTENPRILFACEGVETKKVLVRDNGFELWSKVMTMFKDPESGEVLNGKPWKNPFTGAMNTVKPNIIGSKTLYQVLDNGTIIGTNVDKDAKFAMPPEELKLNFTILGDKVQVFGQRKYPDRRPIPLAEFATTTADLGHVRDAKRPRVDAVFAAAFLAPWQGFLEMPQQPGHSLWHAVGRKMEGFDGLSPEYLEQARTYIPDVLDWVKAP